MKIMKVTTNRALSMSPVEMSSPENSDASGKRKRSNSVSGNDALQLRFKRLRADAAERGPVAPDQEFRQDIDQFLRKRWLHQRTIGREKVGLGEFGELRRQQLQSLPGGESVAAQYGLIMAQEDINNLKDIDDLDEFNQPDYSDKLHINNKMNVTYHRSELSEAFEAQCNQLYLNRVGPPKTHETIVFINSTHNAPRLLSLMPQHLLEKGSIAEHLKKHVLPLSPGIYAVRLPAPSAITGARLARKSEEFIQLLGARPSPFRAAQSSVPFQQVIKHYPPHLISETRLALQDPRFQQTIEQLRHLPDGHSAQPLTKTTADLLETMLSKIDWRLSCCYPLPGQNTGKHIPLPFSPAVMQNSLKSLLAASEAMTAVVHDGLAVSDCYRIVSEEMHVLLSSCTPYGISDFKASTQQQLSRRIDKSCQMLLSKNGITESFLFSSGMHAISLALDLAQKMGNGKSISRPSLKGADSDQIETPIYFEVEHLLDEKPDGTPVDKNTLYTTLNSSMPEDGDNSTEGVIHVIASTKKMLADRVPQSPPLTLILDNTIEKRHDIQRVTQAFAEEIGSGQLNIILCKSYQKYASLGTAKPMSGSITLIGKSSPLMTSGQSWLRNTETNLNWIDNPESQLMVHMLGADEHEFAMLERAAENAQFVKDTLFIGKDGHVDTKRWEPGLPFIGISMPDENESNFILNPQSSDKNSIKGFEFSKRELLHSQILRERSSFGFTDTSMIKVILGETSNPGEFMRISFGMESKTELCERLYMASRLLENDFSTFSCPDAKMEMEKLLDDSGLFPETPGDKPLSLAQKMAEVASHQRGIVTAGDGKSVNAMRQAMQVRQQNGIPATEDKNSGDEMRQAVAPQQPGGNFLMSKLASVAYQLSWMGLKGLDKFGNILPAGDKRIAEELVGAFVESGMHGVSPHTRAYILEFGARMAIHDLSSISPATQKEGVRRLLALSERMGGMPVVRLNCLNQIDDDTLEGLPIQAQRQIIDKLFVPLDNVSCLQFIAEQVKEKEPITAGLCMSALEKKLQSGNDIMRSDTLEKGTPFSTPGVISPRDVNFIKESLIRFQIFNSRNR